MTDIIDIDKIGSAKRRSLFDTEKTAAYEYLCRIDEAKK